MGVDVEMKLRDTDWEALIPWSDTLAENDPHWEKYENEPYRAYFRTHSDALPAPADRNQFDREQADG